MVAGWLPLLISPVRAKELDGDIRQITVWSKQLYTASGKNDILLMRGYFQGASWERPIPEATWRRLELLGVTRTRLINFESGSSMQIDELTGKAEFDFSSLLAGLQDCKKFKLTPHIIVGQLPQAALLNSEEGEKYGVRDWNKYEQYAYAFLKFITVEQGIHQADFEVANEPDINGASWLLPGKLRNGDTEMYRAYLQLYQAWSHAANKISKEHPELILRIGGPALTSYTFSFWKTNWGQEFIQDIAAQKLRLDFFSFHFYGNNAALTGQPAWGPYPRFPEQVAFFRDQLDKAGLSKVPIYLTEWGPSYVISDAPEGIVNGNHVGAAWAARFLREMAENRIDEGMALIFRDHVDANGAENWAWPSFLLSDGLTAKAFYNLSLMFMKLPDQRVQASAPSGALGVIAGGNKRKVSVLVYNQNWNYPDSQESAVKERLQFRVAQLPFNANRVHITIYSIDANHGDAHGLYKQGRHLNQANTELCAVDEREAAVTNHTLTLNNVFIEPSSVMLLEITSPN